MTSDILPTILDLLGIKYTSPRPLDGISLLPILHGETTLRGNPIGFQSAKQIAWQEDEFKLYSADQGKTWELYNLLEDPTETLDLSATNPQQLNQMKSDVIQWIRSCKASDGGNDY